MLAFRIFVLALHCYSICIKEGLFRLEMNIELILMRGVVAIAREQYVCLRGSAIPNIPDHGTDLHNNNYTFCHASLLLCITVVLKMSHCIYHCLAIYQGIQFCKSSCHNSCILLKVRYSTFKFQCDKLTEQYYSLCDDYTR